MLLLYLPIYKSNFKDMILDKFKLSYRPYSNKALLIQWPRMINESVIHDILRFKQLLSIQYPDLELVPSYNSLCLISLSRLDFESLIAHLKTNYAKTFTVPIPRKKIWHIPVGYALNLGIDMEKF